MLKAQSTLHEVHFEVHLQSKKIIFKKSAYAIKSLFAYDRIRILFEKYASNPY